jgi:(p)ppGpp synthase/HD superfamily hydrolase
MNDLSVIPNGILQRERIGDEEEEEETVANASTIGANISESNRTNVSPSSLNSKLQQQVLSNVPTEYADPEQLCQHCLPIQGDQIVGTWLPSKDSTTTVHRVGCPRAQRAINQASANQRSAPGSTMKRTSSPTQPSIPFIDSESLRELWNRRIWKRHASSTASKYSSASTNHVPIPLAWSDLDDRTTLFLTEVVVHAADRKLLLADCSEVASESSEIVKTGSLSNEEHATLIFLVKVGGLEQLQGLMDRLGQIRSVMSVERRFGSELLP